MPAPQQWSPDAHWWWDGAEWIPREEALARGVAPPEAEQTAAPRGLPVVGEVPGSVGGHAWDTWPLALRILVAIAFLPVAVYVWIALSGWRRAAKVGAAGVWSAVLVVLLVTHLPSGSAPAPAASGLIAPQRSPTPRPSPSPSATPLPAVSVPPIVYFAPTPTPTVPACQAQAPPNPFGYDFCPGQLIYTPPANVCQYFHCVHDFWDQPPGFLVECRDGTYSRSGGRRRACSKQGGELQPVYSH